MKKYILLLIMVVICGGCSINPQSYAVITIKGSDTVLPLAEILAEEYMKANPGISVYVYGGGTAGGIKALTKGEADIAMTSRKIQPEEVKTIAERFASLAISYMIAKDAVSIYLNDENEIKNLTLEQIKEIFSGKIKQWSELGGNEEKIDVCVRNPNSGTYVYFKQHILLSEEFSKDVITKPSFDDLVKEIKSNKNAIGFGGVIHHKGFHFASIDGIEPSEDNIINDRYPLTRYLYFYTAKTAEGHIKEFINWVLSTDGQKIIKKSGHYPLWTIRY